MPEIDLEPRRHSSSYELKPMSRWWLVFLAAMAGLFIYANGIDRPISYLLVFLGVLLGFAAVLVFPRYWLSRRTD
jgi:4-hydroxybenzoate polyprenyltransferase